MLSLETTGAWSTAQWTVTIAAVSHDFTSSTSTSAHDWLTEFCVWVPTQWSGKSVSWAWSRNSTDGGAKISLEFSHSAQIANSGSALSLLGVPNGTHTTHTGTASASGTWAPSVRISVTEHLRILGTGDAAGNKAGIRPGSPGLAGRRPRVEAIGTALDAARLASVLASASNPRRAWIYQVHRSTWRNLALGEVTRNPDGMTSYRWTMATAGEVI